MAAPESYGGWFYALLILNQPLPWSAKSPNISRVSNATAENVHTQPVKLPSQDDSSGQSAATKTIPSLKLIICCEVFEALYFNSLISISDVQ